MAAERMVVQGYDVATFVSGTGGQVLTGRYESIDINLVHSPEKYLETEEQIARNFSGEFDIDGQLRRGWQDMKIIRLVTGYDVLSRGAGRLILPKFTVTCVVNAPEKGFSNANIQLTDVTFTNLSLSIVAGKGVSRADVRFVAEGINDL